MLPYTVGTQASLGFVEWNGRSLTDNAPSVMFSTAANTPIQLGIGKESVTSKPRKTFPYVPTAVEGGTAELRPADRLWRSAGLVPPSRRNAEGGIFVPNQRLVGTIYTPVRSAMVEVSLRSSYFFQVRM
jgi:hypothetical protein